MTEHDLKGFRITEHISLFSKEGDSRAGYHCPDCGCFYAEGNYSIENTTYIIGSRDQKSCCGKKRPTPRLFETVEEARGFTSRLETSGAWEKATLIEKRALIIAHFNQQIVTEHKRKTLH